MAVIYISSTYEDLKKEREAASRAARDLGHTVIAMEEYVACSEKPVKKCLEDVKKCDAYIGIFALRYGHIAHGDEKSITQLEYETARDSKIPCLIFLLDETSNWPIRHVSTGEERLKIEKLRQELRENHVVSSFIDAAQLTDRVYAAVKNTKFKEKKPSPPSQSQPKVKGIPGDLTKPGDWTGIGFGKYVIREKLGKGGKGVVFKVTDLLEDRAKAFKVVPHQVADSPAALKGLRREVNNASRIIHPNVVRVLGLEKHEGQYFIVMEYIEGRSLEQILAERSENRLKETEVIRLMTELARGLHETHKNKVIHRDIKPANIMVTTENRVKILDFGISYHVTKSMTELVGEDHKRGTLPYMAPEQLTNRYGRENEQVDIWGFGVTMYQLLSGELPFKDKEQIVDIKEKPLELEGISRKMRKIVMKCLEKDRKKRFKNMEEVLAALNTLAKKRAKEKSRKKRVLAAASIVVLIAAAVLLNQLMKSDKTGVPPTKQKTGESKIGDLKAFGWLNEYLKKGKRFYELFNKAKDYYNKGVYDKALQNISKAKKIMITKELLDLEKMTLAKLEEQKQRQDKEKAFTEYFSKAKDCFNNGEYDKALPNILKAKEIKNTDELKDLEKMTLAKLEEQKQQQDERAFASAKKQDTSSAYKEYLAKYPSGRHASEAERLIKMPDDVRNVVPKARKVDKNKKGFWEADYGGGIKMVYIPAGEFTMGSNEYSDEKKSHKVHLDGYWMGKTEVTMKQYKVFISDKGHRLLPEYAQKYSPGNDHPVVGVSWEDAVAYCNWLSGKKGLNFKLPTEAQWEKAARGADSYKYPWGNREPDKSLANFNYNIGKTSPVGSYPQGSSPYGLLDMAGNVWEWCSDWYKPDYYKDSPTENPTGPKSGALRVVRGGGWDGGAWGLRCAFRNSVRPSYRVGDVGFRLSQDN